MIWVRDYFRTKSGFLVKVNDLTIKSSSFHSLPLHVITRDYVKLMHVIQPLWQNRVHRLAQVGVLGNCVSSSCLIASIAKRRKLERKPFQKALWAGFCCY